MHDSFKFYIFSMYNNQYVDSKRVADSKCIIEWARQFIGKGANDAGLPWKPRHQNLKKIIKKKN